MMVHYPVFFQTPARWGSWWGLLNARYADDRGCAQGVDATLRSRTRRCQKYHRRIRTFRPLRPPPHSVLGRLVELSGRGAPCGGCPRDVFRRVETSALRPCVPDPMWVVVSCC